MAAALTTEQIEGLRRQLESSRAELSIQVERAADSTRPVELDQQSVGRVSRVDAIQQQQMAIASRAQAERQLGAVERALARIADGEFGDCQQCGEAIAFARLRAQPFAALCIECQSANEEKG